MYKGQLARQVAFEICDDGAVRIGGKEADTLEAAFLCGYLIQKGEADAVRPFIDKHALSTDSPALWLWVIGEFASRTGDTALTQKYAALISQRVDDLAVQWSHPRANWLGLLDSDIYVSHIAMAFGAAQSVYNAVRSENAQKLMKMLQDVLFEKFLFEGKVVSGIAAREVMGDITLIAVPFGLMDAGNQILVASVNELETTLMDEGGARFSLRDMAFGGCTRSDLSCLLAWYYAQRGDVAQAKALLAETDRRWTADGCLYEVNIDTAREKIFFGMDAQPSESLMAYVLYALADLCISEKSAGLQQAGVTIRHNPEGTGNKYLTETMQRVPDYPLENEHVTIRMIAEPLNMVKTASVCVTANQTTRTIPMSLETSAEGERYWQADIGSFAFGQTVGYTITVDTGQQTVCSQSFSFAVRRWVSVGQAVSTHRVKDGIALCFKPLAAGGGTPQLTITETGERTLKLAFHIAHRPAEQGNEVGGFKHFHVSVDGCGLGVNDHIRSYSLPGKDWLELLTDGSGMVCKIRYNFRMAEGERFFGMGERYTAIEYRGLEVDNYVYNQYTGQKLRTYLPVPFTLSSDGYAVYADTPMYAVFRFGTRADDLLEIEADILPNKQQLDIYLFSGTPKQTIPCFATLTGKPALPPKWAFGPWMSSHNWDSERETLRQAALTREYEIPATVMVLEQWSDEATFYIFNDARYEVKDGAGCFEYGDFTFPEWGRWQNPRDMVKKLHEQGLKVLLWQAPVQKDMDGIVHEQRDEDERVMLEKGYHVKRKDGTAYRVPTYEWFKRSLIPDFTNTEASEWWLNKRRYLMEDVGIDGFKTDGGECVYGEDVVFFDGRTGEEMRNLYPNTYISKFHEYVNSRVKGGTVTFSRAGYTGAQAIPLHWAGDEFSTFEAYRASVCAGLSCGMSGIPFWGWDLGGFHGEIPSAELYVRSAQFAAFCPVMQYHAETKGEQNRDRTPWNIAERTGKPYVRDIYKKFADLRMNMLPYIYEQAKISSATGLPLMRAMAVEYPHERACSRMTGQYFFGESLMAAPVTEEGSSVKEVYLPEGAWLGLFDGTEYKGPALVRMAAGIDTMPVLIKHDSIIALNLDDSLTLCSHVGNDVTGYRNLCFMLYVTEKASCHFDDGEGNALDIAVHRTDTGIHVSVTGKMAQPVTLILRQAGKRQTVLSGRVLTPGDINRLSAGGCAQKNSDIYVRICGEAEISLI